MRAARRPENMLDQGRTKTGFPDATARAIAASFASTLGSATVAYPPPVRAGRLRRPATSIVASKTGRPEAPTGAASSNSGPNSSATSRRREI